VKTDVCVSEVAGNIVEEEGKLLKLTLSSVSGFTVKKYMPVRKSEISTGRCSHPYSLKLFVKFVKQE